MSRTTIGKYVDLELIGQGGMAEVYIGRDPSLNRKVAIKLILPHLAKEQDFETRFQREAKTVAALRQSNIINIFEYAIEDGAPYMVMEYLEGGTLEDLLMKYKSQGRTMPLQETSDYLKKIAAGLDYAHKRDIIHRDIKPSNILLTDEGEPIIADFGIVKLLHETAALTHTGGVVGSPRYLPPEQASQQPIDKRSDIYSLGIVAYEMVTGDVPFDGDIISVMMQHVNKEPESPKEINADIPEATAQVILRALEKDPNDRYNSVGEFAKAFADSLKEKSAVAQSAVTQEVKKEPAPKRESAPKAQTAVSTGSGNKLPIPQIIGGIVLIVIVIGLVVIGMGGNTPAVATDPTNTPETQVTDTTEEEAEPTHTEEVAPDEPTFTPEPPTATFTYTPEPTATYTPFPEPWVQITNISLNGSTYVVEYETYGFTETLPGEHIHFFFNTVPPEQAGSPGSGPWFLYGGPNPFQGYGTSDKPADATQLCALFANPDHSVIQSTGNCYDLP